MASAICNSWIRDLGIAAFDHTVTTGHVFKTALFTSSASFGASTTAYSVTNEISGTGYSAGGVAVASSTPVLSGNTTIYDYVNAAWAGATLSGIRNIMLYDDTHASNASVFVIDLGSDAAVTAGTLTIVWPVPDATNAIVRFVNNV